MRFKSVLGLLFTVCLALLLSACSKTGGAALTVAGAEIPQDVYAYFLDRAVSKPADYGLDLSADTKEYTDKAAVLCAEYVAVNTTFSELRLSLTVSEKAAVSSKVNNFWRIYADYYTAIGVTKQSLTKIELNSAQKERIFLYYYDTEGIKAVDEAGIKAFFSKNYAAFKAINGYLTKTGEDGNTVDLTQAETAALTKKFTAMAKKIAGGDSIDEVGMLYAQEQESSSVNTEITVINRDDAAYPKGFFEAVAALKAGSPEVLLLDKYIFLVIKEDIEKIDEGYYLSYRTECLKAMKGDELNRELTAAAAGYSVEKQDRIIEKLYERIAAAE